ncbi:MAG: site-specific integrase [Candidatus Paceibacterota bacterium]|jgi:site-specific recombinase XerD|nr:site-specific integrase [Candidatus Paceibacterota bacterium]
MKLTDLKTEFLEHLEIERGRSLKTIENYDHYLSRFVTFSKIADIGHNKLLLKVVSPSFGSAPFL